MIGRTHRFLTLAIFSKWVSKLGISFVMEEEEKEEEDEEEAEDEDEEKEVGVDVGNIFCYDVGNSGYQART